MPQAAKPGVVPLRPLGVGEILDGAITTMRANPKATIGLSAIVIGVTTILTQLATASFVQQAVDQSESVTPDVGLLATGLVGLFFSFLLTYIATTVLTGMLTVVIGQAVLGKPISLGETWQVVRPRIWALIGCSLLSGLILVGAVIACILPFFYFWPMISIATPALVLERQKVTRSIGRSMELVKPDFWRCLGIVILGHIIVTVVGSVVEVPFALLAGGGSLFDPAASEELGLGYYVLTGIGAIISGAITQPIAAGMRALLYVDRRIRQEGLDVTLAAAAAGA